MKVLRARLYEMELRKQQDAIAKERRGQVGTGERSEKIRTYNFPQNRITDHRINFTTHQLTDVMNGDLVELVDRVVSHYQAEKLKDATEDGPVSDHVGRRPGDPARSRARRARAARGSGSGRAARHHRCRGAGAPRARLGQGRVLARRSDAPPSGFQSAYEPLVARRAASRTGGQIAGYREFWDRDFEVSRDVLTPRPETELIVEEALAIHASATGEHRCGAAVAARRPWRLVDVGTGSGCLAVTLALELPGVDVLATEISRARAGRGAAERHSPGRRRSGAVRLHEPARRAWHRGST